MNKFLNEKLMPVAAKIGSNTVDYYRISSDDYCDWICNSISGGMAE